MPPEIDHVAKTIDEVNALRRRGDNFRAIDLLKESIAQHPHPELHLQLSNAYSLVSEIESAFDHADIAARMAGVDSIAASIRIMQCLVDSGRQQDAMKMLDGLRSTYPSMMQEDRFKRSYAYCKNINGETEEAISIFDSIIEEKGDLGLGWKMYGDFISNSRLDADAYERIVDNLTGLIESGDLDEKSESYCTFARGEAHEKLKDYRAALEDFLDGKEFLSREYILERITEHCFCSTFP